MTSVKSATRHNRTVARGANTRVKAFGALAALTLTAGLVVTAGGSASARNCDIGDSACRGGQPPASSTHPYP